MHVGLIEGRVRTGVVEKEEEETVPQMRKNHGMNQGFRNPREKQEDY